MPVLFIDNEMIPLPFTLEMNKLIELRAVLTNTSLIVTGFVLSIKSAKAPHPEQRRGELEIRPVLLQLGVVHVNCKQLETDTTRTVSVTGQHGLCHKITGDMCISLQRVTLLTV